MRNRECGRRRGLVSCIGLSLALLAGGCSSRWREPFDKGVDAYRQGRFPQAVENLEKAAAANPDSVEIRVYLANAYLKQYKPGSPAAAKAEEHLRKALEIEPSNKPAVESLAWLQLSEAQSRTRAAGKLALLAQAANSYRKLTTLGPRDSNAFYWLGVVRWLEGHERLIEERARLHLEPEDEGPISDDRVRQDLGPIYDDAIGQLKRALEIDPGLRDAMVFMSFCIRDKADLAASDDAYAQALRESNEWSQKAQSAKTIEPSPSRTP